MGIKQWIINYRQFARGRRDIKKMQVPAVTRNDAIEVFNAALELAKVENPLKFNNVKIISVRCEVKSSA